MTEVFLRPSLFKPLPTVLYSFLVLLIIHDLPRIVEVPVTELGVEPSQVISGPDPEVLAHLPNCYPTLLSVAQPFKLCYGEGHKA